MEERRRMPVAGGGEEEEEGEEREERGINTAYLITDDKRLTGNIQTI